jgi:hypothetical protein
MQGKLSFRMLEAKEDLGEYDIEESDFFLIFEELPLL